MKKIMIIGSTSCGKTTFCQALNKLPMDYKKTQTVEVYYNTIDTPGEYLDNRNLYRALLVTSVEAEVIILMQDCTDERCMFAPSFSTMFNNKPVYGIVSKIDLSKDKNQIELAKEKLLLAGAEKVFEISSAKGKGIETVRNYLTGQ